MPVVVGVDSSTQSTKVEVRDLDSGELISSGRASHPSTGIAPVSETNPTEWIAAFDQAYAQAGALVSSPKVVAISVAGQQHGLVTLDAQNNSVRAAKLWNDTESAADAKWCVVQRGAQWWASHVGSVPVASFTVAKLSWLKRVEPKNWTRVTRVCLPHDYLSWHLRGGGASEIITDRGDASGTGYWAPSTGHYDQEILQIIDTSRDWSAVLPRVAEPLESTGHWGDAVIGCGTGDNMAGALGIGLAPGDVAISLGTSGTVYAVSAQATADSSAAVAGFADATGSFLPLVCTLNATKVFDSFANFLNVDLHKFGELAMTSVCGANELVLLPYLDGERTPNLPDARAMLIGLNSIHSRNDVARAAIEGVVCGLLDGLNAITNCGVDTSGRIFLLGGGAQSPAVCQIVADLTGKQVNTLNEPEIVALGAARQAAATLTGKWPSWVASSRIAAEPSATITQSKSTRERFADARLKNFGV
ncbi:MAG: xylulokinase [Actinobacteria bacterium]|nr:MAG: xylulokinase [Actinomycetota bacterium]